MNQFETIPFYVIGLTTRNIDLHCVFGSWHIFCIY